MTLDKAIECMCTMDTAIIEVHNDKDEVVSLLEDKVHNLIPEMNILKFSNYEVLFITAMRKDVLGVVVKENTKQ